MVVGGVSGCMFFNILYFKRQVKILNRETISEKSMGLEIVDFNSLNFFTAKEAYLKLLIDQTPYIPKSSGRLRR